MNYQKTYTGEIYKKYLKRSLYIHSEIQGFYLGATILNNYLKFWVNDLENVRCDNGLYFYKK